MAKSNKKNNEVDDLLDDTTTATAEAPKTEVTKSEEVLAMEKELAELKQKEKELKAKLKGEKPPVKREVKGVMVAFRNKKGDIITGPGVLYYVARHNGKLHYKEASQVVMLPEGWKEGDEIPNLPEPKTEEAAAV